jgi:hypothetical protein
MFPNRLRERPHCMRALCRCSIYAWTCHAAQLVHLIICFSSMSSCRSLPSLLGLCLNSSVQYINMFKTRRPFAWPPQSVLLERLH